MASNWLWDFLTDKNKALDEAYKNSTLRGNNLDRQLKLINKLDAEHDKTRGIKVHTIPRDTRNQSQSKVKIGSRLDFGGEEAIKNSEKLNAMFGHKPTDTDNKAALLEETKPRVITAQGGQPFGKTAPRREISNTVESSDSKDPVKLPEIEKGRTRWVGANSTWVGRDGKVIAPHISVLKDDGSIASNKDIDKAITTNKNVVDKITPPALTNEALNKLNADAFNMKSDLNIAKLPKNIDLSGQALDPTNISKGPSFVEGMKLNPDANLAQTGGLSGAAALKIGKMLIDAFGSKKGGEKQYVKEAGTSDINKVAVAAGIDPENFYGQLG